MQILHGDCLEVMKAMPADSVDLVLTSPPYEDARTYGVGFDLKGQDWVDWAVERYMQCVRVSKGLVVWVIEGRTRNFQWTTTPALLMADLHRAGVKLRKPPIYHRVGIPGSGGPDWWRNDYEFCVCSSKGKLPWSDNVATGHEPKCPPGGAPSHRTQSGERVSKGKVQAFIDGEVPGSRLHTKTMPNGEMRVQCYTPPAKANPGNVVKETYTSAEVAAMLHAQGDMIKCHGGGGHMGSPLAHENEAPFPEALAEPFIRCFCPPGGTVLDPFCGSGTTLAVARKWDREAIGIDVRETQVALSTRRVRALF